MQSHQLYEMAMKRGDAKRVAAEMGYRSGGEVPRRWRRPLATATNLFTGELSPVNKARLELLAHDRVNPDAADILLFALFADVARQRAQRVDPDEDAVLVALVAGYQSAITAFLVDSGALQTEEDLYRAGAAIVRALLFVIGDDGAGVPLLKVEPEKTWFERAIAWVRGL
jgi:hypothetical protein